jgi:hypothetical protein
MYDTPKFSIEMEKGIGDLKTLTAAKIKAKKNWSEF